MDRRLEGLKRLGGPVGVCGYCRSTLLLVLPDAGESIYRHHWHVEERSRLAAPLTLSDATWVACSEKCAFELSETLAIDNRGKKKRYSYHAPVCVESS